MVFQSEISEGDSTHPDLLFGIFIGGFGHLWQQGRIVEAIQCSSRAWHLPAWGFGTSYGPDLFLHWSSLSIQPLEACCILLEHFVATLVIFMGAIY